MSSVAAPQVRPAGTPSFALPRAPRYHSLDLWRGVACLLVIFYHATLIHHGSAGALPATAGWGERGAALLLGTMRHMWVGVPMFFVISGYCIAATADSTRRRPHAITTYFTRRFRRIFPPYWAVVVLSVLFVVILDYLLFPGFLSSQPRPHLRPWWFTPWQWFGNLTLTESWRHHLIGEGRGHFVGHSWTLCYEEQFYAVTGLLLCFSTRRFFSAALVTTLAALALMLGCYVWQIDIGGFFFDGAWLMFAAGILVYYVRNYGRGWHSAAAYATLLAGVAVSVVVKGPFFSGTSFALAFAILLLAIQPWDARLVKARVAGPLLFCGTMCYSLYLVHALPVRAISKALYLGGWNSSLVTLSVTVPLCLAVSVLCGWAFYRAVEARFLNKPQRMAGTTAAEPAPTAQPAGYASSMAEVGAAGR